MKKLLVANWKLYINKPEQAHKLLTAVVGAVKENSSIDVVICAPFLLVPLVNLITKNSKISTGAQNISDVSRGAFTGEISAHLLKDYNVTYAIVGHSERRYIFDETDKIIARKVIAASKENIKVILCVGEKSRSNNWKNKLLRQVLASTQGLDKKYVSKLIIAYEPVWAIGTGKADTPKDAEEAIYEIKKVLTKKFGIKASRGIKFLYGGSVTSKNIVNFLASAQINGALVGRASTDPKDFAISIKKVSTI